MYRIIEAGLQPSWLNRTLPEGALMRPCQTYRRLQSLAVGLTLAALLTACGNDASDAIDKAQKGVDKAQDTASKAASALDSVPTSAADAEKLAKEKGTDLLTRDMSLSGNAQCSRSTNDKVTLTKLQGWDAGPYYADIRWNETNPEGPFSLVIPAYIYKQPLNNKSDADPMRDWSVQCKDFPKGYVQIQFFSGEPNIGQATEPVVLHVKP